jgi:hypothetical protein
MFWNTGFVETLHIERKRKYVDTRGFQLIPVPPPLRYSRAGFSGRNPEILRD